MSLNIASTWHDSKSAYLEKQRDPEMKRYGKNSNMNLCAGLNSDSNALGIVKQSGLTGDL